MKVLIPSAQITPGVKPPAAPRPKPIILFPLNLNTCKITLGIF